LGFVSIVYANRATQGFAVYKVRKKHIELTSHP